MTLLNKFSFLFQIVTIFSLILFQHCANSQERTREQTEAFLGKVTLPAKASNLFFFSEGFMDNAVYIAMDLPEEEAWDFIQKYANVSKANFKPISDFYYLPIAPDKSWNLQKNATTLAYEYIEKSGLVTKWSRSLFYDVAAGRLFIKYTTY